MATFGPDLNPCNFIEMRYLKEKYFLLRPANIMEMGVGIVQLCEEIQEDLYCRIVRNVYTCHEEVVRSRSGHIEHAMQ